MCALYSRTTHVANGTLQDIWARVDTDDGTRAKELNYSFEENLPKESTRGAKSKYAEEFCKKNGYTKMESGTCIKEYTARPLEDSVYVSVVVCSGKFTCGFKSVQVNRSVIVDRDGNIRDALYSIGPGESAIWRDQKEINHYPY